MKDHSERRRRRRRILSFNDKLIDGCLNWPSGPWLYMLDKLKPNPSLSVES
jgi:hypothetical protein